MEKKSSNIILIAMVLGAVLGVVGGYYFGDYLIHIKFLGTIFLNALKMIVIPLIVASMIIGVTSLGDIRKLGKTTGKTLLYYLVTTGFSVLIGLILVNVFRPGDGVPIIGAMVPDIVAESGQKTILDVIVSLIPDNIFAAASEGRILPLIVFSLLFGGVLTAIGRKGKPVITFFEGINLAIMKLVMIIIYFAPIGVFALIASIVAENRGSVVELISGLGWYSFTVILGLLIHGAIVLPIILKMFGRKNPLEYFLNMGQALATAFTTASSSATLPLTMEAVEEKNQVDKKASSFVLPLGATINMDGTALYEAVAALFIAQIYGIDLSIGAQIVIFFTATLASIGAAGIPHAGTVTMVFVLSAVGLPLEGIGLIWAIDWFLDRCRTTVNVWGDSVGAAVIGETAEIKRYFRQKTISERKDAPIRTAPKSPVGKPAQVERPSQPNRDKSPRYQKPASGGYKKDDRPRKGYRGQVRPDKFVKDDRPPRFPNKTENGNKPKIEEKPKPNGKPALSKEVIDKELNKVKRQLDKLGEPVQQKPSLEKEVIEPKVKDNSDDVFSNVEFSKMNLFNVGEKKESTSIVADEPEPIKRSSDLSITLPDIKSVSETTQPDEKKDTRKKDDGIRPELSAKAEKPEEKEQKDEEKTDSDNNDNVDESDSKKTESWGRSRKKRPAR
ncbi:MAG: cation:dicarboxylase symporter family transporter [Candidatus Zixiibacteriota bacterium]